jgi:hypothetical protein
MCENTDKFLCGRKRIIDLGFFYNTLCTCTVYDHLVNERIAGTLGDR